MGLPPIGHICLFWTYTEAPSLHRHYPASSVVRASPPPHTARPVSRELPVDRYHDHRWGFPCCVWSPMRTCRRHYPGRSSSRAGVAPAVVQRLSRRTVSPTTCSKIAQWPKFATRNRLYDRSKGMRNCVSWVQIRTSFRWNFLSSTIRAKSGNSDTFGEKMEKTYPTACIKRWTIRENAAGACGPSVAEDGQ